MEKLIIGNLNEKVEKHPQTRGWFLGNFMTFDLDFLSNDLEIKWAHHKKGEIKVGLFAQEETKTLTILISGKCVIDFPEKKKKAELSRLGDYVYYDASSSEHTDYVLEDSLMIVVRWPSRKEQIRDYKGQ